jgi:hypothetical protein
MSVNELEEILSYVGGNAFSRAVLLDFRSRHLRGTFSVHQQFMILLREKNLPTSQNPAVRKSFEEVWRWISAYYKSATPA